MAFPPLLSLASARRASQPTHSETSGDSPDLSVPAVPAFDTELWSPLEAMQLDPPDASATFVGRLAHETGGA